MSSVLKSIKTTLLEFISNYVSIPLLAWVIVPFIITNTFVSAIFINISMYYTKVRHFEPSLIGQLLSLYYIGSFIGVFTGGSLTLKYSSMKIASISCLLLGINFLILLNVTLVFYLKILMLLLGLLTNLFSISNMANFVKTAKIDPEKKLQLINLELVIYNLSFSLSAFVLIKLSINQIHLTLILTSFLLCFLGIIAHFIKDQGIFSPPIIDYQEALCRPKSYKKLGVTLLFVTFVGLMFSMSKVIYTPTIAHRFGDTGISVLIASINPWIIFLVQPFLVNRLKKRNHIKLMGIGGFIIGISYLLFGMSSSLIFSALALTILTLGEMMFAPISKHRIVSLFQDGREGFALGLWRSVFLGSGFFGSFFSGWLSQNHGNMLVWKSCGILGLFCLGLSLMVNNRFSQIFFIKPKITTL